MRTGFAAALLVACMAAAAAGAGDPESVLAAGDPDRGKKVFRKCVLCHTVEKDGGKKLGPNLWGIVGAPVAAREGFSYSKAMTAFGGNWTLERLDAYLKQPRVLMKGTSMIFVGLKNEHDRTDVIAYLNSMSDNPANFGSAPTEPVAPLAQGPEDFGIMFVAPGASETFDACTPCHSERIVAQQGLTREQWDELLDWMVEEQEMEPVDASLRTVILDYLGEHYGPDRPNFPGE